MGAFGRRAPKKEGTLFGREVDVDYEYCQVQQQHFALYACRAQQLHCQPCSVRSETTMKSKPGFQAPPAR